MEASSGDGGMRGHAAGSRTTGCKAPEMLKPGLESQRGGRGGGCFAAASLLLPGTAEHGPGSSSSHRPCCSRAQQRGLSWGARGSAGAGAGLSQAL